MATCEDNVGLRLKDFIKTDNSFLLSYHPPDGKAYETDLIRIPRRGLRTSAINDRYHIDLIYLIDDLLLIIELKCTLSESEDDVIKLQDITNTYSLNDLKQLIKARLTTLPSTIMDRVEDIVIALGVEKVNADIPPNFVIFESKITGNQIHYGKLINEDTMKKLNQIIEFNSKNIY